MNTLIARLAEKGLLEDFITDVSSCVEEATRMLCSIPSDKIDAIREARQRISIYYEMADCARAALITDKPEANGAFGEGIPHAY